MIHSVRSALRSVALALSLVLAACALPVGLAATAAVTGCAASPARQAVAIDASIAGYERSVMRLHAAGLIDDDDLEQAHAFAVAGREAVSIVELAASPSEQQRALDIAESKLVDLASIVATAGGEPPGSGGVFGHD